jgi:hypothetical protein
MPTASTALVSTLTRLDPAGSSLQWSTFFPSYPTIEALVVDDLDEVTITGHVAGLPGMFPITPGVFGQTLPSTSSPSFFVTRMNASGSAPVWSTYVSIGSPHALALDGQRGVVVAGETGSLDFLVTPGAFQPNLSLHAGGGLDGFVTRFSSDATQLFYSTYLGGIGDDGITNVDCSPSGIATVTVSQVDSSFPITPGAYDPSFNGNQEVAVSRLDPHGSKLYYSTFLGGPGIDYPSGISVSPDGRALVVGETSGAFPVTPGSYDTTYNGGMEDLFAAELDLFLVGVRAFGNSTPASCVPGAVYLNATRMPSAGDPRFGLYCTGEPRGRDGWLLFGTASTVGTNLAGATLWLDPSQTIVRRRIRSDQLGFLEEELSLASLAPGSKFACQALFMNPPGCTGTSPFSMSNALLITVQP